MHAGVISACVVFVLLGSECMFSRESHPEQKQSDQQKKCKIQQKKGQLVG